LVSLPLSRHRRLIGAMGAEAVSRFFRRALWEKGDFDYAANGV
jgi:hypothetical protein